MTAEHNPTSLLNTFHIKGLFKVSKGKKCEEENHSQLRYIQIEDLRHNDNLKYAAIDKKNILCRNEDIIIAWDGANAGTIGYGLEGAIGSTLAKLSPITNTVFSPYAGRFLQSKFNFLRDNCTGATIPHISTPSLLGIKIPLPPLAEQQKIASILDAADSLRQKDQQLIEKYNALSQSLFLEMFGDLFQNDKGFVKQPLKELSENVQIGPFGSQLHKHDYINNGIPLINPIHIVKSKIVPDHSFTLSDEKYDSLPNYHLQTNDIVMARRGEMGRCAIVTEKENNYFCGTGSLFIRPKKSINPLFLLHALSSKSCKVYLEQNSQGVTMMNLNKKIISNLEIGVPPVNLQNQFTQSIQSIEAQKQQAQASLQKSTALFNSLLQRAFKGELTV